MSVLQNRLAKCLAEKGKNQSWLAHRLKMSRAYVSRLMRGKIQPSLGSGIRIARQICKPVEEIFQLVEMEDKESPSTVQLPGVYPSTPGKPIKPAEINQNKPMKGKSA